MTRPSRFRSPGRGALPLLALVLVASATVRLGGGTGQAIAREMSEFGSAMPEAPVDPGLCAPPPDIAEVLSALEQREARIATEEEALVRRQAELSNAEADIKSQLAALVAAEEELEQTLAVADQAAEGDVSQLTQVYEAMKPKEAAALFETMEPSFAAGFLARMNPQSSAAILAGLTPETAYTISVVLAGRHASVPVE
ncbi:hypothetical protein EKE94_10920 [Mesobaculum littorinae]|uniref:Magnesium transporter MgtE intracellular domain-containing protein n=1 Tax=Mesobaculum littorinae TaxID=2486419 RepID=A0A438AGZ9_9RHOB|nr:hypothetical protein [Mesobaculum littorinae]RVV97972.1 hypothetical protein EKE94_10920 [Mesobaculum littorinae]